MKSRFILPVLAIALTAGVAFGVKVFAGNPPTNTFTEASSTPPGDNAYAPLDTSGYSNQKQGGLVLNLAGSKVGLEIATGTEGIGTASPLGTLDVENGSNTATICLNTKCIGSWGNTTNNSTTTASTTILSAVKTYTSNGTWTKPSNLAYAIVEQWGGGGGGSSGNSWYGGGGGGGGAYVETFFPKSSLTSSSYAVTVGQGGDFTKGGDTTFDGIVAGGGYAGNIMAYGAGGNANVYSSPGTTILAIDGQNGGPSLESVLVCQYGNQDNTHASSYYYQTGGTGGDSPHGGTGGAPGVINTFNGVSSYAYLVGNTNGQDGMIGGSPGSGGGGGAQSTASNTGSCAQTSSPGRGQPGADGEVIIYEYTYQS